MELQPNQQRWAVELFPNPAKVSFNRDELKGVFKLYRRELAEKGTQFAGPPSEVLLTIDYNLIPGINLHSARGIQALVELGIIPANDLRLAIEFLAQSGTEWGISDQTRPISSFLENTFSNYADANLDLVDGSLSSAIFGTTEVQNILKNEKLSTGNRIKRILLKATGLLLNPSRKLDTFLDYVINTSNNPEHTISALVESYNIKYLVLDATIYNFFSKTAPERLVGKSRVTWSDKLKEALTLLSAHFNIKDGYITKAIKNAASEVATGMGVLERNQRYFNPNSFDRLTISSEKRLLTIDSNGDQFNRNLAPASFLKLKSNPNMYCRVFPIRTCPAFTNSMSEADPSRAREDMENE